MKNGIRRFLSGSPARSSLARRTLWSVAIRISVVMAVATAISYWNVRTGLESQALESLERYVEQRRDRESTIFQLASGNVTTFASAYEAALQQSDLREAEGRFASLFEEMADGTTRLREDVFRTHQVTGFVGRHLTVDRDLKRRLVAAVDLVSQFGPAWSRHFANLYVITPEGAVVMYWPGQPWARKASDWEVSGKLALLASPNEPVIVTGPSSSLPPDQESWSELYFDYGVSDWLVSVTRPVLGQGRHLVSVGHDILLHDLIDRTVKSDLKGTYNFLVSEQGRLIAHPLFMEAIQARNGVLLVDETRDPTLGRLYRLALERSPEQTILKDSQGSEYLAVTRIGGPGWLLATVFPQSIAAAGAWTTARLILIWSGVALAIEILILGAALRHSVTAPLRRFIDATSLVASGRFDTRLNLDRKDEIGELASSFNAMSREVDAREKALVERGESLARLNERLEHELEERKKAERELAQHRELNALLNVIDYGILFLDPDLKVRIANRAYKDMWGLDDMRLVRGMNLGEVFDQVRQQYRSPEVDSGWSAFVEERLAAVRKGDIGPRELRLRGGRVLRASCVALPDGGRMLTFFDITDQRRALKALQNAEQRLRMLLEVAPFPLSVTRFSDGRVVYANARIAEALGVTSEEAVGSFAPDFYADPRDRDEVLAKLARHGRVSDVEVRMRVHDGREFWALINAVLIEYEGEPALMAAFNNITELKNREAQLREAKHATDVALRDLNAVLDTINYGVLFLNAKLEARLANRAYRDLWAVPGSFYDRPRTLQEDMEQSRRAGLYDIADEDWDSYREARIAEIRSGSTGPRELSLSNGKIIQSQCIALPDGGRMLTYFDITELKRTETALRRHLAAMEAATDGMAILTGEAYAYVNEAHAEIYGYADASELTGRSWRDLYTPEEAARFERDIMPILLRDGHWTGEAVGRKRDGTTFPQDLSLTLMEAGFICVVRDITERHAREAALRDAKQLAEEASLAKSRFLANMSHEVRTPLNAVLGFTELMLDDIYGPVPERARGVLERVQFNGRHLLSLINDILDLSKIEAGELAASAENFSVRALVRSAVAATEALAKAKGLELRSQIPDFLPPGLGDERRLTQVLLNLLGNAIKFTDEGFVQVTARQEGERLKISVTDTGTGIAREDHRRIFETFQQGTNALASKHGGTGLGLAISKRIIEMHGGTIELTSEAGQGSTFTIDLPVGRELATEAA